MSGGREGGMGEGPALALWIVRAASLLVPTDRERWRKEWEGELRGRWEELRTAGRLNRATRADLRDRALGAVPDALHLLRLELFRGGLTMEVAQTLRALAKRPGCRLAPGPAGGSDQPDGFPQGGVREPALALDLQGSDAIAPYSGRMAVTGSTDEARRAGR